MIKQLYIASDDFLYRVWSEWSNLAVNEAKLVVAVDYDSRAIFLSRIEMQVANAYLFKVRAGSTNKARKDAAWASKREAIGNQVSYFSVLIFGTTSWLSHQRLEYFLSNELASNCQNKIVELRSSSLCNKQIAPFCALRLSHFSFSAWHSAWAFFESGTYYLEKTSVAGVATVTSMSRKRSKKKNKQIWKRLVGSRFHL